MVMRHTLSRLTLDASLNDTISSYQDVGLASSGATGRFKRHCPLLVTSKLEAADAAHYALLLERRTANEFSQTYLMADYFG